MKKPLEPLIPLDDLKDVVRGLIAVPKDRIAKPYTYECPDGHRHTSGAAWTNAAGTIRQPQDQMVCPETLSDGSVCGKSAKLVND